MTPTFYGCLLLPIAFTMGSIPFGFIAGKRRGIDLREQGSKSIGATNTLRVLGKTAGITVLILDAAKGLLPVLAAKALHLNGTWMVLVGLAAVLGHIYSPFVRFRGGKGVATSLGVLIALSQLVALGSLAVFAITVKLTRYVSLGSLLSAVTAAILFFLLEPQQRAFQVFGLVAASFVILRHRTNIRRLLDGTENRLGTRKPDGPDQPAT